jgi:transposase InsO family protein
LKYVVVVVEYFSKWIEAKALATITLATIQKFLWQNVICCFRVPKSLTVDNGTKFGSKAFIAFYNQVGTNMHFASIRHPKSNGLVERANDIILLGTTKSLVGLPKGKCTEELIKEVWNHNTSMSRSIGFTSFKLLFEDEAMTLEEVKLGSARALTSARDEDNENNLKDTIEESRLKAIEHIRKYQAKTIRWRDRKVELKNIAPGHLVL